MMDGLRHQDHAAIEQHRLRRKAEQQGKRGVTKCLCQGFDGVVADGGGDVQIGVGMMQGMERRPDLETQP